MGMFSQPQPGRRGMLDPAMMQRMMELQSLMGADPSGTGMVQAPPGPSNPSFDAWSAANPVPLAYTGMPPGEPPPQQPGMPPPGGMGMPPQTMQMDQGMQPAMPQQPEPQIAPGEPGEAAAADPFFQALAGLTPQLGCGESVDMPSTASMAQPPNAGRTRPRGRLASPKNAGPSESDRLNAQMLASILARRSAG